jgi:DNA-binding beta-propeller fold protein YncE
VRLALLVLSALLASVAPASAANVNAVIATVSVPGSPFASVSTHDGSVLFVSVSGTAAGVVVFRVTPKALDRIGFVALRTGNAFGMALLADDSTLLVADNDGVALIDAKAARTGAHTDPVYVNDDKGAGSIEVAVTPDGRTAFVSDENLAQVTVLRLQRQPNGAPGAVGIGRIAVDRGPVGFAFSPDAATLYLASEIGIRAGASFDASGQLTRACPAGTAIGTLTAIDVAHATVVAHLAAGCSPVRVAVTANGATVWVSVRGEDRVIAFDAAKIRTDPTHAFVAQVAVGSAPVGMALLAHDSMLAVANSNRFDTGSTASTVTVLQLGATTSPRSSFATGSFPREFSVSPNGSTLFLTNFNSGTVQMIDVGRL